MTLNYWYCMSSSFSPDKTVGTAWPQLAQTVLTLGFSLMLNKTMDWQSWGLTASFITSAQSLRILFIKAVSQTGQELHHSSEMRLPINPQKHCEEKKKNHSHTSLLTRETLNSILDRRQLCLSDCRADGSPAVSAEHPQHITLQPIQHQARKTAERVH